MTEVVIPSFAYKFSSASIASLSLSDARMKSRIVFLNPSRGIGGSEVSMLTLLEASDIIEGIILGGGGGHLEKELQQRGVQFVPVELEQYSFLRRPFLAIMRIVKYAKILRRYQPTAIVCNLEGQTFHAFLAARLSRKAFFYVERFFPAGNYNWRKRYFMHNADGLIFVSSSQAEAVNARVGTTKARKLVLYNPVSIPENLKAVKIMKAEIGLSEGVRLVGLFGRIANGKGLELLPNIAAKIRRVDSNVRFIVVGECRPEDIKLLRTLEAEIDAKDVRDVVSFLGHRSDVADLMHACDVTLLLSEAESFGRVIAESWAVGTPVVAGDLPATRELLGEAAGGFIVSDRTADEFTRSLTRLLKEPDSLQYMGLAGQRWVKVNCDPKRYAERYAKFILGEG